MAAPCPVCTHPFRDEIELDLVTLVCSMAEFGAHWRLPAEQVNRHYRFHQFLPQYRGLRIYWPRARREVLKLRAKGDTLPRLQPYPSDAPLPLLSWSASSRGSTGEARFPHIEVDASARLDVVDFCRVLRLEQPETTCETTWIRGPGTALLMHVQLTSPAHCTCTIAFDLREDRVFLEDVADRGRLIIVARGTGADGTATDEVSYAMDVHGVVLRLALEEREQRALGVCRRP